MPLPQSDPMRSAYREEVLRLPRSRVSSRFRRRVPAPLACRFRRWKRRRTRPIPTPLDCVNSWRDSIPCLPKPWENRREPAWGKSKPWSTTKYTGKRHKELDSGAHETLASSTSPDLLSPSLNLLLFYAYEATRVDEYHNTNVPYNRIT